LRRITQTLLDPAADPGTLRDSAIEMHMLLSRISGMDLDGTASDDSRETILPAGKAISPQDAARCVLDYARTTKFLRGVRAAIDEGQRRFPGEILHVFYAGCGPFAALLLPLATVLRPDRVQFTLVDIHPRSLQHVRRIVKALHLSAFIREYLECDATVYDHGQRSPIHILVIESLQKALAKEPQVALAMNLVPQMSPSGILIPERITLTAALADITAEILGPSTDSEATAICDGSQARGERVVLGPLFEVSVDAVRSYEVQAFRDDAGVCIPARTVTAKPPASDTQQLVILTNIRVFDSIVLGDYECGLTYPTVLPDRDLAAKPESISFVYRLGRKPGLVAA
jgi:hypothetical protein